MSQGPSWPQQGPPPPGQAWRQPRPPKEPDARPLHRRKRVWLGGFGLFILGAALVTSGDHTQVAQAEALVKARPTVMTTTTATATARVTVTAKPSAAPTVRVTVTVTKTATATVTVTAAAAGDSAAGPATSGDSTSGGSTGDGSTGDGSTGGGSTGGGSSSGGSGTCSLTSSAGNCYRAGEFCPARDLGLSTTDANGTAITCEADNGYNRWMDS